MSLGTFAYGVHDLQTVTVTRLPSQSHPASTSPAPATATAKNAENGDDVDDDKHGYWVILIHGGAWRDPTQTSSNYLTPALSILSSASPPPVQQISGLASISYRLSPHPSHPQDPSALPSSLRAAKHPDHLADVQSALAFLQKKYGFGGRYVLVGHSCGATVAFQTVMDSLKNKGTGEGEIKYELPLGILGMAGIYDLRRLRDSHRDISAYEELIAGAFGDDEEVWDAASPGVVQGAEGVEGWKDGRAVVLAHSRDDELCDTAQSENMKVFLEGWKGKGKAGEGKAREVQFLPIEGQHDEAWMKGEELARAILVTIQKLRDLGV
ncbi:arylformamidase [Aspergillus undulatus]|uniref:arylformamidase n=1 Tax=Aspergillus undulatus TaxID=1810928 RepID=UPI003CCE40E9